MKSFLKIAAAVLLSLFISFWGYIHYKRRVSYRTLISRDANALIRVDMFALYKSMAGEFFNRKKRKETSFFNGLSIPANIFFFTVKDKQPTTLFSSLPIDDFKVFEQSLKAQGAFNKSAAPDGITILTRTDRRWTVAYNASQVAFAYAVNGEKVQEVLVDLLQQKNTVTVTGSPFKTIKEQEGHLTFLSGDNKGALNFEKGVIRTVMNLSSKGFDIPAQVQHPRLDNTSVISLWLYADLQPLLCGKTFTIDTFHLSGDSLLAGNPRGFILAVTQPVLQKDSIVTYEYNDDFEKVATTTIKETTVPGIYFQAATRGPQLYSYLQKQHIILADSGTINRAFFPLYQVYAATLSDQLQLTTIKTNAAEKATLSSPDFFHLEVNFERLEEQRELAPVFKYIRTYKRLELKARKQGPAVIQVDGALFFRKEQEQALLQLLDGF